MDYVEGGYPLSNEKDVEYFRRVQKLNLRHAKVCAFGMTRRKGIKAQDDLGMQALAASGAPVCTVVEKPGTSTLPTSGGKIDAERRPPPRWNQLHFPPPAATVR